MKNNNPIIVTDSEGKEKLIQFVGIIGSNGDLVNATNKGLDVSPQDQVTDVVNLYLNRDLSNFVLSEKATIDSYILNVNAGHGAVAGNYVCLQQLDEVRNILRFYQAGIVTANATSLELTRPLDFDYDPAKLFCSKATRVNIAGETGTINNPVIYKIGPKFGSWDIYQIHFVIFTPSGTMDDGTFGALAKLAHGITFRKKNGHIQNLFNIKSNGELLGFAETSPGYTTKPPAGTGSGLSATISLKDGNGVACRLDASNGSQLELWLSDSLAAWAAGGSLEIKVEGHVVE